MRRFFAIPVVLLGVACVSIAHAQRAESPTSPEWPLERVELRDGRQYSGLIESEDDWWINLAQISRTAGRPMHLVIRPIERRQVAGVVRLDDPQRAELQTRVDGFINRATIEAGRMEAVAIGTVKRDGATYRHYAGRWFSLDSTIDELTTRRIIVRVEQIFTAYRQVLPPISLLKKGTGSEQAIANAARNGDREVPVPFFQQADRGLPSSPLRLLVFGSPEEYHAYLNRLGLKIDSRACYLRQENLVVAGSEVARFAAELAKVNARHEQLRRELDDLEQRLKERLRGLAKEMQRQGGDRRESNRLLVAEKRKSREQLDQKQKEINRYDRENAQVFDRVTGQMFTRLYHEAFHAYLENYVYPHDRHDVPLWLNEGLAVLFEGGLLESDSLRIDAPNAVVLRRLKTDLASRQPLSLAALLAARHDRFAQPRDEAATSDRYYLYAWGVTHYLAFERHLLGSTALDRYVERSAVELPPVERFERFIGVPLPIFERQWREYVANLR